MKSTQKFGVFTVIVKNS